MKKYLILLIIITCFFVNNSLAQLTISSPFDKAVYQRNTAGSASISISGQLPQLPCGTGNSLKYRISKISLSNGSLISVVTPFTNISNDARGRFFFLSTLATGWYLLEFQIYFNNVLSTTSSIKFGVGDVYILAGQSNAQSISLSDRPNQRPTMPIPGDVNYEAVVSCNYSEYCMMGNGKMPRFPVFSTLTYGNMSGNPTVTTLGSGIAPTGYSNWAYKTLGNKFAEIGVPVAFFNAAAGGSSIRNWFDSRTGGGQFCFGNPVAGEPYATLKKTLNYYGSLFGVRAILWHQGEADNKFITALKQTPDVTPSEYKSKLEAVITQSRNDFNPQLTWVVSKASYNENVTSVDITNAQSQVIAGTPPASPSLNPLPILGAETDQFNSIYRLDGVHFNNGYDAIQDVGIDGLRYLAFSWWFKLPFTNGSPRFPLTTGSPISASPVQDITVVKNSGSFTFNAPSSGYSNYYWISGNDRLDNKISINPSLTISGSVNYRCFLQRSNGKIEITTSGFGASVCAANRISSEEPDFSGTEDGVGLRSYPNPSNDDFTIEFDVPFESESVKVDLAKISGETVKLIAQGSFTKGHYTYPAIGKELQSGIYICRLMIDGTFYSTKLVKIGK